jgi:hypothetical protein
MESMITTLYQIIGIQKPPEILQYKDPNEAFADYASWNTKIEGVSTCFWHYQLPIAHPNSFWAKSNLEKDGYRLNIRRKRGKYGCLYTSEEIADQRTGNRLNAELYHQIWERIRQDPYKNGTDVSPITFEYEKFEKEMEALQDRHTQENPTCQFWVDDYIFLTSSKWLKEEYYFYKLCVEEYQIAVNQELYHCLKEIIEKRYFLFTFTNLVIVTHI